MDYSNQKAGVDRCVKKKIWSKCMLSTKDTLQSQRHKSSENIKMKKIYTAQTVSKRELEWLY